MSQRNQIVLAIALAVIVGCGLVTAQGSERTAKAPGADVAIRHDWRLVVHAGCRFAVPMSWRADASGSTATAADGSNISIRMFHIASWTAHKARIKAAFGQVNTVHEDSDRRLWFEIGDRPRVQHYIDVVTGLNVCSALLEVRSAGADADDVARAIADSIGPAAERWPSGVR